ncbi:AraC family transcriptional regulator [Paenibacillus sp. HB172176]|uniref:helix-turn-helix domain-containing protein n=1 Tax=Paenibacillus sp. HB172176 TaxID=2493690 RepID=UPI00143BB1CB|nr:AraC family transcriptional regulator [Paenibacillus sp. HB172176]
MTYPKELKEFTNLGEKAYPFQLFLNGHEACKVNQSIMYMHWHEHFEIIAMQKGSAVFHINSEAYEAVEGDVLFVPAGGLHVGYSSYDGPIRYISFVFNASLFNDWTHDPEHLKFVAPYLEGRLQLPVKPVRHVKHCSEYYGLLEQSLQEFIAKRPGYKLVIKSLLHLLFTQLAREFIPARLADRKSAIPSRNRDAFKALLQHLETHYAERMTVAEAARFVKLNPHHFCKSFKKLTGRTFVEYMNVLRMNEAERLLQESDDSITEIAGMVGCDNPNYFTKLFKQHKGVTPSAARK